MGTLGNDEALSRIRSAWTRVATTGAMAVAADYAGWVRELDNYEASLAADDDDDDPRVERVVGSTSRKHLPSRGGSAGIGTGRKVKPSVSEELKQEMKLLNWHKLANEAALKAAIIKTNKIKSEDSRFASSLAHEDVEEKRLRIQQIIEEEQLRPLQVNTEFFREFEAREQRDDIKVETDVQRHIQHLKKLKETMAQREDVHRRRQKYKEGMAELGGGSKSMSVPKAHKSNQEEEFSAQSKRYRRSLSTAQKADIANTEVICSLDKLMELEKRIRHLEDAGLGVDGLDGGGDGIVLEDIDDNNVTSTKNIRFSKRKSSGPNNEPARTVYAVKTVSKARAKEPQRASLSQSTASSVARKRSLPAKQKPPDTFLTSLPDNKQRQLRRMTDRERRNFLKKEKEAEVNQQKQKQDVVIQDWMQRKKQAAQQRKTTSHQAAASAVAGVNRTSNDPATATRRGAGKPLPPPPRVKPPLRGAAAGKRISNPHLQKFDDIRKGFERRNEAMKKAPTNQNGGSNRVLELRTVVNDKRPLKKPAAPSSTITRLAPASSIHKPQMPNAHAASSAASHPQRRPSGETTKLPAISRAPPLPSLGSQRPALVSGSLSAPLKPLHGTALPRLSAASRLPSPPPAKNPAGPQFSRLHKR